MLNIIWPVFILISIAFAILTGKVDNVTNSIFDSSKNAIDLSISLLGIMCLWCGIMNIALKTSFIKHLCKILSPLIHFLFPELDKNDETIKNISMNITANLLGLGNSATPFGLKAMNALQKVNSDKKTLSNSMIMLIVLNTASLQLIPTTVLAIRTSFGSQNPSKVIVPIWIATLTSIISGVIVTKILIKKH